MFHRGYCWAIVALGWMAGTSAEAQTKVIADLAYYGDAAPDFYADERCRLDLIRPDGIENYPTIVYFHGGGLRNGSRRSGDAFARRFTEAGIGLVLVDYRLSSKATCPAYIEDAAAAVAWTLDHVMNHGGDPRRVTLAGHSAGGYLAGMVGLDPRYLKMFGHEPKELAGLVPISGQLITHSTVRAERGISETRPLIDEFAPAYHVNAKAPPTLCLAGDHDLPARAAESVYFAALMEAAGHESTRCVIVPDRDHGSIFSQMTHPGDPGAEAMINFLAHLKPVSNNP